MMMDDTGAPQADGLSQAEPVSRLGRLGFDPSRELVGSVNEWLCRAAKLGAAQRRVILALGADWGQSPDHQATKRIWHGITGRGIKRQRGPLYVVEHKHGTDNCWRLNDDGLRLQVALWGAIAMEARKGRDAQRLDGEASQSGGEAVTPNLQRETNNAG